MRRLLPLSLCVAATLGLTACDQQLIDGSSTEAEQAFAGFRAAASVDDIPGYAGNGDISIGRPANSAAADDDDDDGFDIILYDIADVAVYDSIGNQVQTLADDSIVSPQTGEVLCTTTMSSDGVFKQLRDHDGTVLFSTTGTWTFEGSPDLSGRTTYQQYEELSSHLRFSYRSKNVFEGHGGSGAPTVHSSEPIQNASSMRKLVIASLIDGYCGSHGI